MTAQLHDWENQPNLSDFTKSVLKIILAIPSGQVMCYRDIAAYAGNPRAARQVARILHSMSRPYELPWHRVINAEGRISIQQAEGFAAQKSLLEAEGISVDVHGFVQSPLYRFKAE